jgi:pyruvate,water dikinase
MVESEVSGIAFSVHPVTEDHNQLIIEAGFGLGEAIVSGSVTPDSYVVEKEPRNILDINVSTQDRALYRSEKASKEHGNNEWVNIPEPKASSQVLTKAQILELSEIILKIENHYGFPCDIEWAYEAGKFYIVQSRPITTLASKEIQSKSFADEFSDYTILQPFSRRAWGFINYMVGYSSAYPQKDTWPHGIGFVGSSKDQVVTWSVIFKDEETTNKLLAKMGEDPTLLSKLEDYLLASRKEFLDYLKNLNLSKITNDELKEAFKVFFNNLFRTNEVAVTLRAVDYVIVPFLKDFLKNKGVSDIDESLAILATTDKKIFVVEEEKAILNAAVDYQKGKLSNPKKFNDLIDDLWEKYGLSTMGNYTEQPRTKEYYKDVIKKLGDTAQETLTKLEEKYNQNIQKRKELVDQLQLTQVEKGYINATGEIPHLKDTFRESLNILLYHSRPLFDELSLRINKPETQVKNYLPEEIQEALSGNIPDKEKVNSRIKHHIIVGVPGVMKIFEGDEAVEFEDKYLISKSVQGNELKGRTACRGHKTGKARVVLSAQDFHKVQEGDVLVVSNTTPDYVVILGKVSAIVAEEGGITAHVSVISRELNIPAVVGVTNATIFIKDNDPIEVNADKGIVKIINH